MPPTDTPTFTQPGLLAVLADLDARACDALDFGLIGFDPQTQRVTRYNRHEAEAAALHPQEVLGLHVFTELAQCVNNHLVAQRFDDARAAGEPLDRTIDYVLTWRMRPTPVRLRMLYQPGLPTAWLALQRRR